MAENETTRHTLSVLVQDVDGIISRVAQLFTRRGYSLISLVSGRTEKSGINRLTVVVDADDVVIEQVTKQLNKLIEVLKVVRLEDAQAIARQIMLVKVSADASNRPQVVDAANIFRARIVDVAKESVVIEAGHFGQASRVTRCTGAVRGARAGYGWTYRLGARTKDDGTRKITRNLIQ